MLLLLLVIGSLFGTVLSSTCPAGAIRTGSQSGFSAQISWVVDCTAQTITLNGVFPYTGWVAMGWNTQDQMSGADIGIAWKSGGTDYIFDARNGFHVAPTADTNNLVNTSITTTGGSTSFSFTKAWNTGDSSDIPLTVSGTFYIIFAASSGVPSGNTLAGAGYHIGRLSTAVDFFADSTTPTTAPTVAPTTAPAATRCPAGQIILGQYTNPQQTWSLNWTIDCSAGTLRGLITCTSQGWVGFGTNTDAKMVGGDVFQAYIGSGGVPVLVNGRNTGYSQPVQNSQNNYNVSGSLSGNTVTIEFMRLLTPSNPSEDRSIFDTTNLLWSYNSGSTDFSQKHSQAGAVGIDFFTGSTTNPTNYRVIHGILMILAMGFLAPLGTFVARFLKGLGHLWYILHLAIQYIMAALLFSSFIIIENELGSVRELHFRYVHEVFGLCIVILVVIQILIGILANAFFKADRSTVPFFPDKLHWWLGRFIIVFSLVNIFLGFDRYGYTGKHSGPYIVFAVWLGFCYSLFIVVEAKQGQVHHTDLADGDKRSLKFPLGVFFVEIAAAIILYAVGVHEMLSNQYL